jgi:hypothetical protein
MQRDEMTMTPMAMILKLSLEMKVLINTINLDDVVAGREYE